MLSMPREYLLKDDVLNLVKDKVKNETRLPLKWWINNLLNDVQDLPLFLFDDDVLKDTDTSNNTTLPSYYGEKIDLLTACEKGLVPKEKLINFCELNIIKYVLRYKNKGGISDLKKAKTYLEKVIEYENNTE